MSSTPQLLKLAFKLASINIQAHPCDPNVLRFEILLQRQLITDRLLFPSPFTGKHTEASELMMYELSLSAGFW